jgi:membrane dipeptidase
VPRTRRRRSERDGFSHRDKGCRDGVDRRGVQSGIMRIISIAIVTAAMTISAPQAQDFLARAKSLHKQVPLIDGHNDYPWALREHNVERDIDKLDIRMPQPSIHTDIARLRAGGVGGQFWSVYVPASMRGQTAVRATLEQIDVVHRMVRKYPDTFELADTASDVERIFKAGRIASLIGMEGGHSIDSSLATLRMLYVTGARYMTLTHSSNIEWADSGTDTPKLSGLSKFGEEVVREMNRMGMLVDLSHTSPDTMDDALRVTEAPVIFSHSVARALNDHGRNVPDSILRQLPKNGGVVMVTFVPSFLSPAANEHSKREQAERDRLRALYPNEPDRVTAEIKTWLAANPQPRATLADVANHIDHIRKVAGIDHIGIGSDFDGIDTVPLGLEDVSTYPALTAELLKRGYSDGDVKKILGLNVLRVMKRAEVVAAHLRKVREPSTATIEKLDGVPVTQ